MAMILMSETLNRKIDVPKNVVIPPWPLLQIRIAFGQIESKTYSKVQPNAFREDHQLGDKFELITSTAGKPWVKHYKHLLKFTARTVRRKHLRCTNHWWWWY